MIHLTIIPIENITEPTDALECEAYGAVLMARACRLRQATHGTRDKGGRRAYFPRCEDCSDGRRVVAQLEAS